MLLEVTKRDLATSYTCSSLVALPAQSCRHRLTVAQHLDSGGQFIPATAQQVAVAHKAAMNVC